MTEPTDSKDRRVVDRVQTGVRVERRILKVLKGVAEVEPDRCLEFLRGMP